LSGRNLFSVFILAAVFLIPACASENNQTYGLAEAVSLGIIMSEDVVDTVQSRWSRQEIVTAYSGQLANSTNFNVGLYFPIRRNLYFRNDTGELTLLTEDGMQVQTGEKLANLWWGDERLEISRTQTEIRLRHFNQNTQDEAALRQSEINETRFYANHATNDADLNRLLLQLAQLELGYDRFRFDTNNTRNNLQNELNELQNMLAGEHILAPFDGTVRSLITTDRSNFIEARHPRILTLFDENVFYFSIQPEVRHWHLHQPPVGIVSYGSIVTIKSHHPDYPLGFSTLSFDARVVTDPWGAGVRGDFVFLLSPVDMDGLMKTLYELNPYDPIQALRHLNLQANIDFTINDYGVILPRRAVHTQDRLFYVFVYEQGNLIRRFVNIGVFTGNYVHIVSGVEAGERVVILS